MVRVKSKKNANKKDIPILSHEFIIKNHGDIVLCVVIAFIAGFLIQLTSPVFSLFIVLQYSQVTEQNGLQYSTGLKDLYAVCFYSLICIIFHNIIQEYILDKMCRKFHLSNSNNIKFNESGQLIVFNIFSVIWAFDIIVRSNWFADISSLWTGYPNNTLSCSTKLFYIIQLSYWVHNMPELYFQKTKKEEMFNRVKYSLLHVVFISAFCSITNFYHIGVGVLLLYYISRIIKEVMQLIYITEKEENSKMIQLAEYVYNWLFFFAQSFILNLFQYMLWFGLKSMEYTEELRNYNIPLLKLLCSISALAVQIWIMYTFVQRQNARDSSIDVSLGLLKSKKNMQLTENEMGLSEDSQNIEKPLKNKVKKLTIITKNVK